MYLMEKIMTQILNDNPAQKLLDILEELQARQHENCWYVWCDVLSLQTQADFPIAFAKLVSLIDEIITYLIIYEPDAVDDCEHLKEQMFNAMMTQRFDNTMLSFISYFDKHSFKDLRNFSRLMRNHTNTKKLEKEELDNIHQKMKDLQESILNTENISERLKLSINKYINRILHLVEQYKISSSEEILLNIEALVGHLAMSEEGRALFNDKSENSIGSKLEATLTNIANMCTIGESLLPALSFVANKILT